MRALIRFRPLAPIAAVIVGALAWVILAGLVAVENGAVTPTAVPVQGTNTAVAVLIITATPRVVPTATETLTPTLTATTAASQTPTVTPLATETPAANGSATPLPMIILPPRSTDVPTAAPATSSPTSLPAASAMAAGTSTGCTPPAGWVPYQIQEGDTLFGFQLGSGGSVDVQALMRANCLSSTLLQIGQVLYLPAGVADKSPKVDDSSGPSNAGGARTGNCPCTIHVRSGWRREQIADAIDRQPVAFRGSDFLAATGPGAPTGGRWFLASKPAGASLEGFMFPGDYTLQSDTTAAGFRDMLLDAFGANVSEQMGADAAKQGFTFWQVMIVSSIAVRENSLPEMNKLIVSVIYNRIRSGRSIGSYVTLQYALGRPGSWWPRIGASNMNTVTAYDTLKSKSFPPSPIASPGLSGIYAAIYPPQTEYLYFNQKCGSSTEEFFARTWEEFQKGLDCSQK